MTMAGRYVEQIKRFDNKYAALLKIRQTHESVWVDLMDYTAPDLKGYLNCERKDDGARNDDLILDGLPALYAKNCASSMWAAISSPSRPWMMRKMSKKAMNEVKAARAWLDEITEIDYDTMQDSNFYQAMFTAYYHLVVIGTTCMIIDPDYEDTINCITLNIGTYVLGVNSKGKVDTVIREEQFNAAQLVEKFGEENVPEKIRLTITDSTPMGGEDYKVRHIIGPDTEKIVPFKKPWISAYWLVGEHDGEFLQLKGYTRKNFTAARWWVQAGETYGKLNPSRNSIGNCKQLQTMVYDWHDQVQKVNNPPLQGPSEALVNNQVTAVPGTFNPLNPTAVSDNTLRKLFEVSPDLEPLWQSIQDKKEQIAEDFLVPVFSPVSMRIDKDMTAEEVRTISGESTLALGPALDNTHKELLNEVTSITYYYSADAGLYPEPPEDIQGEEYKVDYMSVLAQAQKMVDLGRIDQMLSYVERMAGIQAAAGVKPQILDKFDFDQTLDEVQDMAGGPANIIRSDETTQEIRDIAAQQEQMMQMAQAATVAADVGQKMSSMPMDTDNALQRMMEGMQ